MHTFHIWVGVWLLVVPFLGVPGSWKAALTVLTAVLLIGEAALRHHREQRMQVEEEGETAGAEEENNVQIA